jgi:hypothetical protein
VRKPVDCQVILRVVPPAKQVPCCVICKMPDELCCCYRAEARANDVTPYWAQEVMDEPAYVSKRPSLWSWNYAAVALGIVIMFELGGVVVWQVTCNRRSTIRRWSYSRK